MHYTTIPKGYRLTLDSWENDGDNYNTKVIAGLDAVEIEFYVELAKLHYHRNRSSWGFGNLYEPNKTTLEPYLSALKALGVKYKKVVAKLCGYEVSVEDYPDAIHEIVYDIGLSSGDFYTRVLESFIVEYIPEDVEIQDVTIDFI